MGRALVLLTCCTCAFALNPELDVSQYAHKPWKISDGFARGSISAIAQTPDGYLWLGTEFGLLRFDGVRNVEWAPPGEQQLPNNTIRRLLVSRDGTLWIGTLGGLASWKGGRLTPYAELAGLIVDGLLEDHEGTVWAGGGPPNGKLCAIRNGAVRCYGEDGRFGRFVEVLYEYRGDFWAAAQTGLWRWKPDPPKLYAVPALVSASIRDLIEGDNGMLWMTKRGGTLQLKDGRIEAHPLPVSGQFDPTRLLRDREGGLWIGTDGQGLLHLHQGRADVFASVDGLSGDQVHCLFEDREGNIWVATTEGLDHFRDFAVPSISVKQGLSGAVVGSVLAARNGAVWVGTNDGLNRWNNGQLTIYRKRRGGPLAFLQHPGVREIFDEGLPHNHVGSLFQDGRGRIWVPTLGGLVYLEGDGFFPVDSLPSMAVYSIAADGAGNLWLADQLRGLLHLLDGKSVEQIPWERLGHKDYAIAMVSDHAQGGLWLGFVRGGVAYFKEGQIRVSYTASDGLGSGRVSDLRFDPDGTLWAATDGGLSRLKNGRISTLTRKNGLPCDAVHSTIEDDDHSVWLHLACGMRRVARSELDAWAANSNRTIQATVFDSSDGVRSRALAPTTSPHTVKSADGKLWFVTEGGVSVVDPRHLPFNKLPPPVHVDEVKVDGKDWDASHGWRLPALTRDLEIDYTALSLVAPEKNRFRIKLEGRDRDWQDAGNERKKSYTDLPPRSYRFRVMASNNSGAWNEAGDSLDFSIAPAYYQTTWFRVSVVAAFLALLWVLYLFRLDQIAKEFNARLEGRVDERTRVARELHDTLLQSFHGLLPRLQAAVNLLPGRASDARRVLEAAVDDAAHAITEARDAVQDMRSSATTENDLAKAVEAVGQELAAHHRDATGNAPAFSLEVEGAAQDLHPILRDEIYRIASEALRNAFHHAQARRIEVEIRYDPRQLRVRLRDDGIGIDADVLRQEGREGHFGFRGMRERAKGIGGKLEIWSQQGAGTEVELIVPASVAYAGQAGRRSWLFGSKVGTNS